MITLSASQQRIVDYFPEFLMNDEKEMVISGFAGSGKTFLVQYLADMGSKQQQLVKLLDPNIPIRRMHFTATTNKAAAVLHELTNKDVPTTIHSLLGLRVENDRSTGKTRLVDTRRGKDLNRSIVFIDEASMVNLDLLEHIRKMTSKFRDCKVIYIGDKYQLPPVKEDSCPVFENEESVHYLDEIQRQVADNPVIQLSAKYREVLDDHEQDWPEIPNDGNFIIHHETKETFFDAIRATFVPKHSPNHCKIVAWSNNRVISYNKWIRQLKGLSENFEVGEDVLSNKPLFHGKRIIAPTDSIHRIVDIREGEDEDIAGFWVALAISGQFKEYFLPANWRHAKEAINKYSRVKNWADYFRLKEQWLDLRPIHASTVHKAQGSTYNTVFVDMKNISKNNKWREVARLVYVAITRASECVHIYGNLHNNYTKKPLEDLMEAFRNGIQTPKT